MITPDGLFRGVDELRELFTGLVDGLPLGSQFAMMKQVIEGESPTSIGVPVRSR